MADQRIFNQPPKPHFDPTQLDENTHIVYDYDEKGNLRRIRKVRVYDEGNIIGWVLFVAVLIIIAIKAAN